MRTPEPTATQPLFPGPECPHSPDSTGVTIGTDATGSTDLMVDTKVTAGTGLTA
ncbi:hypothetical protein [Streptomyces sp. NPDC058657]|uniref:hypothetical protein n=1 Tax=unclassified Streptomyces TaxID=2593676 RepID=UPI00365EB89F